LGENHFYVSYVFFLCLLCHEIGHVPINIHRIDFACGTDGFREPEGKITPTGSQISDAVSRLDLKGLDDSLRLLPMVAPETFIRALFNGRAARQNEQNEREEFQTA